MKRVDREEESREFKRAKTQEIDPFDPTLEKNIRHVFESGITSDGFISGKAFMVWPTTRKIRFNLETVGNGTRYRFDVEFSGACSRYFDELAIHPQDTLQIALRGVTIEETKKSSSPDSFPAALKYNEGVCIKFVRRRTKEDGHVVNTWLLSEAEEAEKAQKLPEDEWFLTPVHLGQDLVAPSKPTTPPRALADGKSTPVTAPITRSEPRTNDTSRSSIPTDHQLPEPARTNNLAKQKDEGKNNLLGIHSVNSQRDLIAPPLTRSEPTTDIVNTTSVSTDHQSGMSKKRARRLAKKRRMQLQMQQLASEETVGVEPTLDQVPLSVLDTHPTSSTQSTSIAQNVPAAPDFKPGFRSENGDIYVPLQELERNNYYNVIGVVTSITPPSKTIKNDWCTSFMLIDPSNYDPTAPGFPTHGFRVNCFTGAYPQWLPAPQYGNVIILKGVKTVIYHDAISGIGYKDRLRWALFDQVTGKAHHGHTGEAPRSEGLAGGFGYVFSPFLQPLQTDLRYCTNLAGWWLAIMKVKEKEMGTVHQISVGMDHAHQPRVHRLISEASPDMPPSGYFDCTVEVLYGHTNVNDVYSLYVTDYTQNPQVYPIQASWCPTELADRVLKVEMWPPANEVAKTMQQGEYYSIHNNRMKVSQGGFLEGSFSQCQKLQKLDEGDAENEPHLQALLERKKHWETSGGGAVRSAFKHRLIRDAEMDSFLSCTVEILHVSFKEGEMPFIFITDYTTRADLPAARSQDEWSRGLDGRVVKVSLFDGQIDMARSVEPGCFYSIRNLRLRVFTMANEVQGRLGGNERLIHKLKTKDTTNEELQSLLQRKEEWKQIVAATSRGDQRSRSVEELPDTSAILALQKPLSLSTLDEILANEICPNKFRVVARVEDFYPLHLDACVVLRCTNCQEEIPPTLKACVACDDVEHSYVSHQYKFLLRLEDKAGTRLHIVVSDEECSLLKGLKPADLRADPAAARRFSERMAPIIGNLVEVHEGILHGIRVTPDTPMIEFTIDSWAVPNGRNPARAYGLVSHRIIPRV